MPALDPISAEKLGEILAQQYMKTLEFKEDVEALAKVVCDELLQNLAQEIRVKVEKQLGLNWDEDDASSEKHYDFGMTFEGDITMNAQKLLAKAISEY
jgi:hypothetical protein